MDKIDLRAVIEETIAKFCQNRIGDKPALHVTISTAFPLVVWKDASLKNFARLFLHETLLSNEPDDTLDVSVQWRSRLKDLEAFIGVTPSYWVHLRVSSRGLRMAETVIDELCSGLDYGCEEWVGIQDSDGFLARKATAIPKWLFASTPAEESGNAIF